MIFAYPIGLLALAGLLIPVLIHLWNIHKGRTVKIGSIAFLGESATSSARSLKLTDLLLFVLRCLILILVAGILAQPFFNVSQVKNQGWILLDKAQLNKIYPAHQAEIDSLLANGFELHDFNVGFNAFSLKDTTAKVEPISALNYNALVRQLNASLPSGYLAYIFADQKLVRFDGDLPQANFNLIWKELNYPDTLKTWSTTFLGQVYEGKSTPHLTSYVNRRMPNLPVVNIGIFEPNGEDSKYIKAALNAIADYTKRKFKIVAEVDKADLVFWLSDKPVPTTVDKVVIYKWGKTEKVNSTIQLNALSNNPVDLKKRTAYDNLKGEIIWADGFGKPLLIKANKTNHYHFYSRFNPLWNDLVWHEMFVQALVPIVLGEGNALDFGYEEHDADQRLLNQKLFEGTKISSSERSKTTVKQSINYALWGLAFLVLIIERMLSLRNKTKLKNA